MQWNLKMNNEEINLEMLKRLRDIAFELSKIKEALELINRNYELRE